MPIPPADSQPRGSQARRLVRSAHRAGPGSLRVTLFYPADPAGVDGARLTGVVPPALAEGPLPVIVFMPGINVVPDSYRWLAAELSAAGCVVALYSLIEEMGPAGWGISPGIDQSAFAPGALGERPSASCLGDVLDVVGADPLLRDLADLDRVVLGGHSAGGTVALHNAHPGWFPGVCAAFAYGGHTMATARLGHGEAAVMPIPSATPLLLLAGARDGVIAASRDRYRSADGPHDPVRSTFEDGIASNGGDCWWIELADGTHFTPCHPVDHTSARSFLEAADPPRRAEARELLADLVRAFLADHVSGLAERVSGLADHVSGKHVSGEASALERLAAGPGVSAWARR